MTEDHIYKVKISDFSPRAIAESGQCFRMSEVSEGRPCWEMTAFGRVLRIYDEGEGRFAFACSAEEFESIWSPFFDLDTDYGIYRSLVLPDDEFLKEAVRTGQGIRILRQDPWETLVSFIISQRKSVPAIRTCVRKLSEAFGRVIEDGHFAFPGAESLAGASGVALSSCGLGYRTGYVRSAAEAVSSGSLDLKELEEARTPELIERLMELNGVGIKVASCTALFGYHRLEAVPVDVWMKRVIDTVYGGALPDEYAPCAGVLQQYMFNYARINKTGTKK